MPEPLTVDDLAAAITAAGLDRRPVCIHSSYRSLGPVAGGPKSVVDAFLACGSTVLVPAFYYDCMVDAPEDRPAPRRNGLEDGLRYHPDPHPNRTFDPSSPCLSTAQMGAIPAAVLQHPGHARGQHPICSFAAVGPLAERLIAGQTAADVFAPLRAVAANDGAVLLLGVGLRKLTIGHAAEELAGRRPFVRWSLTRAQGIVASHCGGCAQGFDRFAPACAAIRRECQVGPSRWIHFPAAPLLSQLTTAIADNPGLTHCDDPDCLQCNDAIAGGPIGYDELLQRRPT